MPVPQSRAEWHCLAAELHYATGHFIHGEHVATRGGRFTVVNPATAEPLCEVAAGDATEVERPLLRGARAQRQEKSPMSSAKKDFSCPLQRTPSRASCPSGTVIQVCLGYMKCG